MTAPDLIVAVILGLVEGLTEFLPVSSTGHLIVAGSLLNFTGERAKLFEIVIQAGAIVAVCWEYRARLFAVARGLPRDRGAQRFVLNLIIAFIPAAVLGVLFKSKIEAVLFAPVPVALALVIGGVIILWAEKRKHSETIRSVDDVKPGDALKVGLVQCLALFPGTSRSAATILGGLFGGMSRLAATEFSFFLAIPTLLAATGLELFEARHELSWMGIGPLAFSSVVSFIAALLSIRFLLRFVSRHTFSGFAWYRIIFGGLILAAWALGWVHFDVHSK